MSILFRKKIKFIIYNDLDQWSQDNAYLVKDCTFVYINPFTITSVLLSCRANRYTL